MLQPEKTEIMCIELDVLDDVGEGVFTAELGESVSPTNVDL